jgi:ion channel
LEAIFSPKWDVIALKPDKIPAEWKGFFRAAVNLTMPYGDITPLSPPARAFAFLEAIIGQIYLAVLVARLVGLYIAYGMAGDS